MAKRLPNKLPVFELRNEWQRTRRFIPVAFRVRAEAQRGVEHWQGGPPCHRGARCPSCRQSLGLVWDLLLKDSQIPPYVAEQVECDRLPFYFCAKCGACSYRLTKPDELTCFAPDIDGESPFEQLPVELPRQRIALERVPTQIDGILTLDAIVDFEWLDPLARKILEDYYGRKLSSSWDLPFSQFGGSPLFTQGHRQIVCPNSRCPASKLKHPYPEIHRDFLMKELAVIEGDTSPEIGQCCAQVAYHICCICSTIHAQYRCS